MSIDTVLSGEGKVPLDLFAAGQFMICDTVRGTSDARARLLFVRLARWMPCCRRCVLGRAAVRSVDGSAVRVRGLAGGRLWIP